MNAYPQWRSLREIDLAAGQIKGSSFRLFKHMNRHWQEGRDFVVLHHQHDADTIVQLRDSGRIYTNSVNVVLLHPTVADALLAALMAASALPR